MINDRNRAAEMTEQEVAASLFEVCSACLAVTRLVSLFEFGFNLYFNNRLMVEPVTKRRLV